MATMKLLMVIMVMVMVMAIMVDGQYQDVAVPSHAGFVKAHGSRFVLDNGHGYLPLYVNGFNAYYLAMVSVDEPSKSRVSRLFEDAAKSGLTVGRTWAFNEGDYRALQLAPGVFDETAFQALDFVISEAKANGIRLILCLANNYPNMGGKPRYVEWARRAGVYLPSDNAFFYDPTVKSYFKNYIKKVVTRVNTITGVTYKDDPTIFAWELMNEARCSEDATGNTLQEWIEEMSEYMKSIDPKHMLAVGLEGFFGPSTPHLVDANPSSFTSIGGSDFVRNSNISSIDFATVHSYPDQWLPNASFQERMSFLKKWAIAHIEVGKSMKKPILFSEFGLSKQDPEYSVANRNALISTMYDLIYSSASSGEGGAAAGGLVWQTFPASSELVSSYGDGYTIVLSQEASTNQLIKEQSRKLSALTTSST